MPVEPSSPKRESEPEGPSMDLSMSLNSSGLAPSADLTVDEQLVRRARQGDLKAFEELFELHKALVFRFCYRMINRRDDAEDMVQEVFIRAFQNLNKYRDEAKFTTWLLRIASNYATDRVRMNQRRDVLERQEASGALAWMTENTWEDPIDNLEQERRVNALRKGIQALPVHHRSVLIMRDMEEIPYVEMSRILGCTIGGAKLRVLRARRALRDRMLPLLEEMP